MRHLCLIIPLIILITGCTSTINPVVNEYTIYPSNQVKSLSSPASIKTLALASTKTIPSLASKNLTYLHPNGESGNYLYTRWSDSPSVLIERSLIHRLQEKAIFPTLLSSTSTAQADLLLESDLHAFYHIFKSEQKSQGVIDITYRIIDIKTKTPIASKRFFIIKDAPSEDAAGGIIALSAATQELVQQSTQWIQEKVTP